MNTIKNTDKYILTTYSRFPLAFERGEGVYLFTEDGRKFLDMSSGIAVTALGHGNKEITDTITEQASKLIHTSNLYYTSPAADLAKKLCEVSVFDRVFFCNSGAEANEGAIKLARKYGKSIDQSKSEIITMKNSFHGRTITTITATGQEKYRKDFDPLTPGFIYCEFNDINDIESKINEKTCAVMLEAIQGEGGIKPADPIFLKTVRKLCDKYKAILIYDEIQTGIGRTGKLFAYEHYLPVEPDVITLAKGLGGGLPIGAFLLKEKFAEFLKPGDHASTFGGNLVVTKTALKVLEIIERDKLLDNVNTVSKYFIEKLKDLQNKYKSIKDIRGSGFLLGIEIDFPSRELVGKLIDNNILTVPAGENVVRFLPPLIFEKSHVEIVIEVLDKILGARI